MDQLRVVELKPLQREEEDRGRLPETFPPPELANTSAGELEHIVDRVRRLRAPARPEVMQKLERLLGSGASARGATAAGGATAARGVTSVKKGGLVAAFAAQSTAKKAQKRPCKPAAQARDDGDDDECAESAASLAPRRKAAGRAAAKKVKYAEVDDDDSGSEFEGELR